MAELMRVPEVATGTTEAILAEWLVKVGETVEAGSPVAVLETEKAQVEVEASVPGQVLALLATEEEKVLVGSPLIAFGDAQEAQGDLGQILAALDLEPAPATDPVDADPVPGEEVPVVAAQVEGVPAPPLIAADRQFISPIARRMLREAGIEPASVRGSGPSGRVVRADVEAAITARPEPESSSSEATREVAARTAAPVLDGPREPIRTPHSRIRLAVARRLSLSKQTVPHFYLRRTCRIDDLLGLRARVNEQADQRISVNDFILKAVAHAQMAMPDCNVVWSEDEMLGFGTADIAVAIASERGLVTPVLRSVEQLSLGAVSRQVKRFVEQANAGKLRQDDLLGGTISVTNLGMYGVEEFSAIINPPHAAILAVGAARPTPVAVDGVVQVATVLPLTLSVDHRAIDGALAAQWMQSLVAALENPYRLMA